MIGPCRGRTRWRICPFLLQITPRPPASSRGSSGARSACQFRFARSESVIFRILGRLLCYQMSALILCTLNALKRSLAGGVSCWKRDAKHPLFPLAKSVQGVNLPKSGQSIEWSGHFFGRNSVHWKCGSGLRAFGEAFWGRFFLPRCSMDFLLKMTTATAPPCQGHWWQEPFVGEQAMALCTSAL